MTLAFLLALVAGCSGRDAGASALLGRWERLDVDAPNVGEPAGWLGRDYVEFREGGLFVILLHDEQSGQFWMTGIGGYTLLAEGQIQLDGQCYRGFESFDCSAVYSYRLNGDDLRITEDSNGGVLAYHRIAALSRGLPPTLAPPMPSPTPG